MSEKPKYSIRLSKATQEFNMSETAIREFLTRKGFQIDSDPNTKLSIEMYEALVKEYLDEKEENDDMESGDLKKERKEKRKRMVKLNIIRSIRFSQLEFRKGVVSIIYKGKRYFYRDPNIKNYDKIIKQTLKKLPYARKNVIKNLPIDVIISIGTDSFSFKNIDIHKYVNNLKEIHLPENTYEALSKNKENKNTTEKNLTER